MNETVAQEIETALNSLPEIYRFRLGKSFYIVESRRIFEPGKLEWQDVAKIKLGKRNVILIARPHDVNTKTLMKIVASRIKSAKFTVIEAKTHHSLKLDNNPNSEPPKNSN